MNGEAASNPDPTVSGIVKRNCVQTGAASPDTSCRRFLEFRRAKGSDVTGVICFCDSMALGIYKAAAELGLTVPDDSSVIGYDDSPIHDFTAPPLTTIHMPKDLVAKNCTQYVLDLLLGGNTQTRTYLLRPF